MSIGMGMGLRAISGNSAGLRAGRPSLDLDFLQQRYQMSFIGKAFADIFTFTRAGAGTRINESGLIESVAANQPRFFFDPVTMLAKGIKIEEQRTNLIQRSSDWSAWWAANASPTRTANYGTAPDGTQSSTRFQGSGPNSGWYTSPNVASGTTVAASIFVRAVSGVGLLRFGCDGGTATNTGLVHYKPSTKAITLTGADATVLSLIDFGNGWVRIALKYTTTSASNSLVVYQDDVNALDCEIWGCQQEIGAVETSYIPTAGSQVTRASDFCSINSTSPWFSGLSGTIYVEVIKQYSFTTNSYPRAVSFDDGSSGNEISIFSQAAVNRFDGSLTKAGSNSQLVAGNGVVGVNKIAIGFSDSSISASCNGADASQSAIAGVPTATKVNIGKGWWGGDFLNGNVSKVRHFPKRLTDSQLKAMTA